LNPVKPPVRIRADAAEFEFISKSYASLVDSEGNVGRCKGGVLTLYDVRIDLNDVLVQFEKKERFRKLAICGGCFAVSPVLPVYLGFLGLIVASHYLFGGLFGKGEPKSSTGEFNISFYGHLEKRPLGE